MHDVAVERGEILAAIHVSEQIGAHRDQIAGAPRSAVEPADQLLPPRFGCEMQVGTVAVAGLCLPDLDRLGELGLVRPEIARQRLEKGAAVVVVEIVVAVEHLARHCGARGFAPARQQRFAQIDEIGGVALAVFRLSAPQQAAATLGNRRKQVGEKGIGHGGSV